MSVNIDKKGILMAVIDHYADGNKAKFARMIGVTGQVINGWVQRNTFDINKLVDNFKDINIDFLLTGNGEMITKKQFEKAQDRISGDFRSIEIDAEIKQLLMEATNIMSRAMEALLKSQQQFDRVLDLHDRIISNTGNREYIAKPSSPYSFCVNDSSADKKNDHTPKECGHPEDKT